MRTSDLITGHPGSAHGEPWRANLRGEVLNSSDGERAEWWWTGQAPESCPGRQADGTLTSLPLPNLATCTRDDARDYFDNTWTLTELLFAGLADEEAFFRPPTHGLRHPLVFYYCHPAVLYVNKLRVAGIIEKGIDAFYEQLFEAGVDEMRWDDMSKNAIVFPSIRDVHRYRSQCYALVREVIDTHPGLADGHDRIGFDSPLWALFMGFEHERIHLETSSVLIRELPVHLVRHPAAWPAMHPAAAEPLRPEGTHQPNPDGAFVDVAATTITLGKDPAWPSYGWDNEYGSRTTTLEGFRAHTTLVTNAEFLEFVIAGGYREKRYWTPTGWAWRGFRNTKQPAFWVPVGPAGLHDYKLRTVFEIVDLPRTWPAEVNAHEAAAYCAWRSERDGTHYRLPSEAEHRRLQGAAGAASAVGAVGATDDPVMTAAGNEFRDQLGVNLNLAYGSPSPVDSGRPTAEGVYDVAGNVWQWVADDFNPLPGARVHPYYDDFSSPCYDGQHQMMLGGSWISTGDEASRFARFHFRPHFVQHAGFRLVEATHDGGAVRLDGPDSAHAAYEDPDTLAQYVLLHFGSAAEQMPHTDGPIGAARFPQRTADWLIEAAAELGTPTDQALDIGCAVGGACFELARAYGSVVGVDLSPVFIDTARRIAAEGSLECSIASEGDRRQPLVASVAADIDRSRVEFRQADACALPPDLVDFDAVLMANLLCRLPSPRALIGRLGGPRGLVRLGGLLAVFSPFTWLERFTPKDAWLGGESGGPASVDVLRTLLEEQGFQLIREGDEPLVIRETARKFQYIVSAASLWQRVD